VRVHLLDIEWLLSTLFDASLLKLRAAGNSGSFFLALCQNRTTAGENGQPAGIFRDPPPFCAVRHRDPWPRGNYVQSFVIRRLDRPEKPGNAGKLRQGLAQEQHA
jgi:hypothetical protein